MECARRIWARPTRLLFTFAFDVIRSIALRLRDHVRKRWLRGASSRADDDGDDWNALKREAGEPLGRPFHQPARLFRGGTQCLIRLWRDREGWCPFTLMTVLLLEAMEIPFEVRKVPLRKYLRVGETKSAEYLRMVPDGVVPGVQLSRRLLDGDGDEDEDGGGDEDGCRAEGEAAGEQGVEGEEWTAPLLNAYRIFDTLRRECPGSFPLGDAAKHAAVCHGDDALAPRLHAALYRTVRRALTPPERREALEHLRRVFDELSALLGGAAADGPYLNGARPAAADFMLLPWLERTEALLPGVPGSARVLSSESWAAARSLLLAARASTPFADYAADEESLRADLHAELHAEPHAELHANLTREIPREMRAIQQADASVPTGGGWVVEEDQGAILAADVADCTRAAPEAKREAAAQLASHHTAVARFAWRKARLPPPMHADAAATMAMDETLRELTSQLLASQSRPEDVCATVVAAAAAIRRNHGSRAAVESSLALTALARNVAVPRDLRREAGLALRAHSRVLAAALREGTPPSSSVMSLSRRRGRRATHEALIM